MITLSPMLAIWLSTVAFAPQPPHTRLSSMRTIPAPLFQQAPKRVLPRPPSLAGKWIRGKTRTDFLRGPRSHAGECPHDDRLQRRARDEQHRRHAA